MTELLWAIDLPLAPAESQAFTGLHDKVLGTKTDRAFRISTFDPEFFGRKVSGEIILRGPAGKFGVKGSQVLGLGKEIGISMVEMVGDGGFAPIKRAG